MAALMGLLRAAAVFASGDQRRVTELEPALAAVLVSHTVSHLLCLPPSPYLGSHPTIQQGYIRPVTILLGILPSLRSCNNSPGLSDGAECLPSVGRYLNVLLQHPVPVLLAAGTSLGGDMFGVVSIWWHSRGVCHLLFFSDLSNLAKSRLAHR